MAPADKRLATALDHARRLMGPIPLQLCYLDMDAAARLADFLVEHAVPRCLVLSDPRTREAAGEPVISALRFAGRTVQELVLRTEPLEATLEIAESVAAKASSVECIIAIGSGTLSDLAKYAGNKLRKPVLLYATAPSMNGYTSGIVALRVRGLKQTLPVAPAAGVFADPKVLVTAPHEMIAAGLADYLSKCSASADWRSAHFLRGEAYRPEALEFYRDTFQEILELAPKVGAGNVEAVSKLFEALLFSGLSMLVAGASSPVSGGEHLISHYIDMKAGLEGVTHDLHGRQVGVGTLYTLGLWQQIVALDASDIDPDACVEAQPKDEDIEACLALDWGPVAGVVLEQWRGKSRNRQELRNELMFLRRNYEAFLDTVRPELERPEVVAKAIRAAGGPTEPQELTIRQKDYVNALRCARFLRNRFTVLDLADELCITPWTKTISSPPR